MKYKIIFTALIPLSLLLIWISHLNPAATEILFSTTIYRAYTAIYGRVFGLLPFSIAQFGIIIIPLAGLIYVLVKLAQLIQSRGQRGKLAIHLLLNIFSAVGILLFMFTIGAGLNYGRIMFGESIGLQVRQSSQQELAVLAEIIVENVNRYAPKVARNPQGHMIVEAANHRALSNQAREIFRDSAEDFPVLAGFVPHVKPIWYSRLFSHMRITGIFVPWTLEPHVNVDVMDYHIPATMLHELAHFRGVMLEDEANFVGWIVGHYSDNICFKYSSNMLALSHVLNQLGRANPREHQRIAATIHPGARTDRYYNWHYWQQFEGPVAEVARTANNAYLRANRQQDGVQSYGRVVDLLLAYYREEIAARLAAGFAE